MYSEREDSPGRKADVDLLSIELQEILAWVGASSSHSAAVEYRPPIDVIETAAAVEIVVDLPGVRADALRVSFAKGSVIVGGRKGAPGCQQREATFHLAERTFGLFARVIRLSAAVDAGRAHAVLRAGELHVTLPRIDERRGRDIPISIEPASTI
jgi:HSP20 family protein